MTQGKGRNYKQGSETVSLIVPSLMIEPVKTLWAASSFSLDSASGHFLLSGEQQCLSGDEQEKILGTGED